MISHILVFARGLDEMTVFVLLAAHKVKFKQLSVYSGIEKAEDGKLAILDKYDDVVIRERSVIIG